MTKTLSAKLLRLATGAAGLCAAVLSTTPPAGAAPSPEPGSTATNAKNIVLVHGAFVDASSWSAVSDILQDDGYTVSAVQNPLTSLHDDVLAVRRVLEQQDGPTVLVGYSWGGMPITEAGDDPKVTALVYVAALAPEVGETVTDLQQRSVAQATMPGLKSVLEDQHGNYLIDRTGYQQALAHDSAARLTRRLAASQIPMSIAAFHEKASFAAWHTKPAWYAVSTDDQIVAPDLQEWMASRIHAHVVRIASGHASILSHPGVVAAMIEDAAGRVPDPARPTAPGAGPQASAR